MECIFKCSACKTRCDDKSKKVYNFKSDIKYSEEKEKYIISQINSIPDFSAQKCTVDKYPDIEVTYKPTGKVFYIEIKAMRRTFMTVAKNLPDSDLIPSETLVLNLSDLVRYFDIQKKTDKPVFIIWCLENRPCIVSPGETFFCYQDVSVLKTIYEAEGDKRRFKRESGKGDVVNGKHLGVTVNYHFSIKELIELDLEELLSKGAGL